MKEGFLYLNQSVVCKSIADAEKLTDNVFTIFDCGDEDLIYVNDGKPLVVMLQGGDNLWETTTDLIEPVEEYKRCSKCGKMLPVSRFYVIGNGKRYSWCKDCTRIQNELYRQKVKEKKEKPQEETDSLHTNSMQERLSAWREQKANEAAKIAEESKSLVKDEGVFPKSGIGFKEKRNLAAKALANASVTDKMLKDELVRRGYSLGDMHRPADNTGDMLVDESLVPDRTIVEELKKRGYIWTRLTFTKDCFIFEKV